MCQNDIEANEHGQWSYGRRQIPNIFVVRRLRLNGCACIHALWHIGGIVYGYLIAQANDFAENDIYFIWFINIYNIDDEYGRIGCWVRLHKIHDQWANNYDHTIKNSNDINNYYNHGVCFFFYHSWCVLMLLRNETAVKKHVDGPHTILSLHVRYRCVCVWTRAR